MRYLGNEAFVTLVGEMGEEKEKRESHGLCIFDLSDKSHKASKTMSKDTPNRDI